MAKRESSLGDKVSVDMTPMIDVVFQLMSFFMCTLKVVAPEGDFDIRMPLGVAAAATPDDQQVPPVRVRRVCRWPWHQRLRAGQGQERVA